MTCPECEQVDEDKWKKTGAYAVDVIRKLLSLVLVDGVAEGGIRLFRPGSTRSRPHTARGAIFRPSLKVGRYVNTKLVI